jgi:hypothetical protein
MAGEQCFVASHYFFSLPNADSKCVIALLIAKTLEKQKRSLWFNSYKGNSDAYRGVIE